MFEYVLWYSAVGDTVFVYLLPVILKFISFIDMSKKEKRILATIRLFLSCYSFYYNFGYMCFLVDEEAYPLFLHLLGPIVCAIGFVVSIVRCWKIVFQKEREQYKEQKDREQIK